MKFQLSLKFLYSSVFQKGWHTATACRSPAAAGAALATTASLGPRGALTSATWGATAVTKAPQTQRCISALLLLHFHGKEVLQKQRALSLCPRSRPPGLRPRLMGHTYSLLSMTNLCTGVKSLPKRRMRF